MRFDDTKEEEVESDTKVPGYISQSHNIDSEIYTDSDSDWESTAAHVESNTSQHTHSESDKEDAGSAAPVDLNDIKWRTAQTIVTVPQWTNYIPDAAPGRAAIEYLTTEVLQNIVDQSNRHGYQHSKLKIVIYIQIC